MGKMGFNGSGDESKGVAMLLGNRSQAGETPSF
jgi:hypothetical protein